ncbi:hypothetical protein Q9R32_15800 [Actinotalea sp. AC32]|nr:hypothetical protein [Actinotalea sp. AC32]
MRGVLTALALVAVCSAVAANAASLPVTSGSLTTVRATAPCTQALSVTTTSTTATSSVDVTVPAGCTGRLQVALPDTGVHGELTSASGTVTVPLSGAFTPVRGTVVVATLDGWAVPARWVASSPFSPANPTTVVSAVTWSAAWPTGACADVVVTTTTNQPSHWVVALDTTAPPFDGRTTGYTITGGQAIFAPPGTPVDGVLGVVGSNNGWDTMRAGQTRTFRVCHPDAVVP